MESKKSSLKISQYEPVWFYGSLKLGEIGSAQEICETFIVTGSKQQVSAKVTYK